MSRNVFDISLVFAILMKLKHLLTTSRMLGLATLPKTKANTLVKVKIRLRQKVSQSSKILLSSLLSF